MSEGIIISIQELDQAMLIHIRMFLPGEVIEILWPYEVIMESDI